MLIAYLTSECMSLAKMKHRVKRHGTQKDVELIEKAYLFAEKAHEGQKRKSGEDYIIHPISVASILVDLMADAPTIAAGLLHDTVEDCGNVTIELIKKEFGETVANMVDGVTKIERVSGNETDIEKGGQLTKEERGSEKEKKRIESIRKMILAMAVDLRVVLIKLADRLHNMRTLNYQAEKRRVPIAKETLEIYAPIAHRIGVNSIKQELEDLSFKYLNPTAFHETAKLVGERRVIREENIRKVIAELSEKLDQENIDYQIDGRPKHLYSIYNKMQKQNKSFDQIYDLFAVRVKVRTDAECYKVLGIVHSLWKPLQVEERFKDYISAPKGNGYQSLHTTLLSGKPNQYPFEMQIRTYEMHWIAEFGVAAHFRYKEDNATNLDQKWLEQIVEWQNEIPSNDFIKGLIKDLGKPEVLVRSPKGDVYTLGKGATPIDFAYRIHSDVGNQCVGAKVNGKMVSLNYELQAGDLVEIITSPNAKGPSLDWLRVAKTMQAQSKIRQFFKKAFRGENSAKGREMLEKEAKRRGTTLSELCKPGNYETLLKGYSVSELEDIYGAVGYGVYTSSLIISKLLEELQKKNKTEITIQTEVVKDIPSSSIQNKLEKSTDAIAVDGTSGLKMHFARCCTPVPGDSVVGYITHNRGITVHKTDCVNAINSEPDRLIEVNWGECDPHSKFYATLEIEANNKGHIHGEVAELIQGLNINIEYMNYKINKKKNTWNIFIGVQVSSKEQMSHLLNKLNQNPNIIQVRRSKG